MHCLLIYKTLRTFFQFDLRMKAFQLGLILLLSALSQTNGQGECQTEGKDACLKPWTVGFPRGFEGLLVGQSGPCFSAEGQSVSD